MSVSVCTHRQGHGTMISEVMASLGPSVKPGAVLVSVGGGGLLCGVIQGMKDVGWMDVPIVAMETVGADCFNAAIKAGSIVTLDDITRLEVKVSLIPLTGRAYINVFLHIHPFLPSFVIVRLNVLEQRQFARKLLNTASSAS